MRVSPHYFDTIGTRLLRGRVINDQDTPSSTRVAVVNETFARRFFPKQDPIGKRFGIGESDHSRDFEIVGIVEDTKYQDARGPAYAMFFLPFLQKVPRADQSVQDAIDSSNYLQDIELLVSGYPPNLESQVRRALDEIDANLTVLSMTSFDEQVARNFNQDRLLARLAGLFGFLALALASIGLYGVTAYNVVRRTNEIGIRMAMGAQRSDILRIAVGEGALVVAIGVVSGLVGSAILTRFLQSMLFNVKPTDPITYAAIGALLTVVTLLACLVPALRATRVDPLIALRHE
jgi:predicted permease